LWRAVEAERRLWDIEESCREERRELTAGVDCLAKSLSGVEEHVERSLSQPSSPVGGPPRNAAEDEVKEEVEVEQALLRARGETEALQFRLAAQNELHDTTATELDDARSAHAHLVAQKEAWLWERADLLEAARVSRKAMEKLEGELSVATRKREDSQYSTSAGSRDLPVTPDSLSRPLPTPPGASLSRGALCSSHLQHDSQELLAWKEAVVERLHQGWASHESKLLEAFYETALTQTARLGFPHHAVKEAQEARCRKIQDIRELEAELVQVYEALRQQAVQRTRNTPAA